MPLKIVSATELRSGSFAIIHDAPCVVKSIDISKTGKHGASKARIEAIGLIDNKKYILVVPGAERIPVPLIEKRKAQILSLSKEEAKASIMDLESFETIETKIDENILDELNEGMQVEYWDIEGQRIIKRRI